MLAGSVTSSTSMPASPIFARVLASLCSYSSSGNAATFPLLQLLTAQGYPRAKMGVGRDHRGFCGPKCDVSRDYLGSCEPKCDVSRDYRGFSGRKSEARRHYRGSQLSMVRRTAASTRST